MSKKHRVVVTLYPEQYPELCRLLDSVTVHRRARMLLHYAAQGYGGVRPATAFVGQPTLPSASAELPPSLGNGEQWGAIVGVNMGNILGALEPDR